MATTIKLGPHCKDSLVEFMALHGFTGIVIVFIVPRTLQVKLYDLRGVSWILCFSSEVVCQKVWNAFLYIFFQSSDYYLLYFVTLASFSVRA